MCYDVDEIVIGSQNSATLQALTSIHKRIVVSPENVHCSQVQFLYGPNNNHIDICCQEKRVFYENSVESFLKRKSMSRDNLRRILVDNDIITNHILEDHELSEPIEESAIRGLGKIMNRSLQFAILNFDHHNALARNLGINDSYIYREKGTRFGSAILDSVEEKNYVMKSRKFNLGKLMGISSAHVFKRNIWLY